MVASEGVRSAFYCAVIHNATTDQNQDYVQYKSTSISEQSVPR